MELAGAAALVTGGSSGIGAACVRLLREAGARVAVVDRHAEQGDGDLAVEGDVSDELGVVGAVRLVGETFGGLDVAVLNAGVGGWSPLVDMTTEEWDRVHAVNLRGTFVCLRESARAMIGAGRGGAIVCTSSVSGGLADRGMAHYATSKAGIDALVRVAARELGPHGIRVNAVAPGTTDTPMFAATPTGYRERVAARTALGRLGTADDVAAAVLGLLRLDWVTGQVLAADGGVSLWSPIDPTEAP